MMDLDRSELCVCVCDGGGRWRVVHGVSGIGNLRSFSFVLMCVWSGGDGGSSSKAAMTLSHERNSFLQDTIG